MTEGQASPAHWGLVEGVEGPHVPHSKQNVREGKSNSRLICLGVPHSLMASSRPLVLGKGGSGISRTFQGDLTEFRGICDYPIGRLPVYTSSQLYHLIIILPGAYGDQIRDFWIHAFNISETPKLFS